MKLALAVLSLLLPSSLASLSLFQVLDNLKVGHSKGCLDYYVLFTKIVAAEVPCGGALEVKPVKNCELRDQLAEFADLYQCVFSINVIAWVEAEGDEIIWSKIASDLEVIQVDDELDGVAEICEQKSSAISEDQIEVETMKFFNLDPSTAGEQEECWEDGIAINEIKLMVGIACVVTEIGDGFTEKCF